MIPCLGGQRSRRYAVDHRNWILKHVKALQEIGFVYRKKPMVVPKPKHPGEFRMFIECRYANSQVQPMAGFLRNLEVSITYLEEASWFWSLDAFNGFLFFPLESECQLIHSFLTEYGVLYSDRTDSRKHRSCTYMSSKPEWCESATAYCMFQIWFGAMTYF